MRKISSILSVAVLTGLVAMPSAAKADSFFSFGFSDGPSRYSVSHYDRGEGHRESRHHRRDYHGHRHHRPEPIRYHHYRPHYYRPAPVVYAAPVVGYAPVYPAPSYVYYR